MGNLLTTESVSPRDRAAFWREVVCRTFIKLEVTQSAASHFRGSLDTERLGPVQVTRIRTDPMTAVRTTTHLRAGDEELCLVAAQLRGQTFGEQDGRSLDLRPGGLTLFDSTRPYVVDFHGSGFDHLVVQFPRRLVRFDERPVSDVTALLVSADSGIGGLAFPFLLQALRSSVGADAETRCRIGLMLLDVLAGALGAVSRSHREDPLGRAKLFALAHLGESDLSPHRAATAAGISVRQLHRLFSAEGATFGEWVRRERLTRCRDELASRSTPVAEIGRRWGYPDAAAFSKAFRAQFGVSPREHRQDSRGVTAPR